MARRIHKGVNRELRNYFIFQFMDEVERPALLEARAKSEGKFTSTISYQDWTPEEAQICLFGFNGDELSGVGIAWISEHKPVSYQKLMRFDQITLFAPLKISTVIKAGDLLFPEERRPVRKLNAGAWSRIRQLLIRIHGDLAETIEELEKIIDNYNVDLDNHVREVLSQQKDAVGTTFDMSGLDRKSIFSKFTLPEEFDSIFDGYNDGVEDEAILHDWSVFNDWHFDGVRKTVRTFRKGDDVLRVIIANKLDLERVTGVDLVYLHRRYKAYTMIQYKRMKPTTASGSVFAYRPDKQFDKEVKRMKRVLRAASKIAKLTPASSRNNSGTDQFRLLENPFYFKYIKSDEFNPSGGALIPGRYIPFGFHELVLSDPKCQGRRGGRIIKWRDLNRYFGTTEFTQLVSDGWVGSSGIESGALHAIIAEVLDKGRSVILAEYGSIEGNENDEGEGGEEDE